MAQRDEEFSGSRRPEQVVPDRARLEPVGLHEIDVLVDEILSEGMVGRSATAAASTTSRPPTAADYVRHHDLDVELTAAQITDKQVSGYGAGATRERPGSRSSQSMTRGESRAASGSGRGSSSSAARVDTDFMLRRMALWRARKERNLAEKRREAEAEKMRECTFQPLVADSVRIDMGSPERLLQPSPLYRDNKSWGYDEHVQRQAEARQRQQERRRHEEAVFATGQKWRHATTVPAPFDLGRHHHRPPSSVADGSTRHGVSSVGSGSSRGLSRMVQMLRAQFDDPPSHIEPPSVPPGAFSSMSSAHPSARSHHQEGDWESHVDALVSELLSTSRTAV